MVSISVVESGLGCGSEGGQEWNPQPMMVWAGQQ